MLSGPIEVSPTTCCDQEEPPFVVLQIAPSLLVVVPTTTQSFAAGHETEFSEAASFTPLSVHEAVDPPVLGLVGVPFPPAVLPDAWVFAVDAEGDPPELHAESKLQPRRRASPTTIRRTGPPVRTDMLRSLSVT